MAKSALGVDIGTDAVHVAHVRSGRDGLSVVNFGGLQLPPGAVREGEVVDVEAVSSALRSVLDQAGIREKETYLGVANQRVVVRQVELPWMPESELRESLDFQAQEHIPLPVEEAELDFYVLEDREDAEEPTLRILLVAGHKQMIADHVRAVSDAGLRPAGVDLNPFALIRAVGSDSPLDQGSEILVDVGAGVTNIVIHDSGVPEFVRILVMGGGDITEALQDAHGLDREEAEDAKRELGLQGDPAGELAETIADQAGEFIDEVRSSVDYYQAQTGGTELTRLVLIGGGSQLGGLAEQLSEAVRMPVEIGNPFDRVPATDTVYGPEDLAAVGPALTVAVGLGMGVLA